LPDGSSFFERYRATSDSTIRMHAFADSAFAQATDSSLIYWRAGHIYSEGGDARSVVSRIDVDGVHFVPDGATGYRFSWKPETADGWSATVYGQQGAVTYPMRRVR
jgi:hypothetical protein